MSKKKVPKNIGNVTTGIAMAASIIPLVEPAINIVHDYVDKIIEEQKKLVTVPVLYSKEYPLSVDQAVELLKSRGLKATLVKMTAADADIQYRGCFDSQVIKTNPKAKQKVDPGSCVLVKYITQEIIDKSQRMFDISEKHKEEQLHERNIKWAEQKEKTKQLISGIIDTTATNIKKLKKEKHHE